MPSPDVIVGSATAIANDWRWLAIAWHAIFIAGAMVMAVRAARRC